MRSTNPTTKNPWVSDEIRDPIKTVYSYLTDLTDLKNLRRTHSFFFNDRVLQAKIQAYVNLVVIQQSNFNESYLYVTRLGKVAAKGDNLGGRLGLGELITAREPTLLSFAGHTIIKASLAANHSVFLTNQNQVFTCGLNDRGQLGLPLSKLNVTIPQLVSLPENIKIIDIHADRVATYLLDDKKNIHYYGSMITEYRPYQNDPSAILQHLQLTDDGSEKQYLSQFKNQTFTPHLLTNLINQLPPNVTEAESYNSHTPKF